MVARIQTVTFQGINALDVDVQVQMLNGNVQFNLVGLPDKAVGESRERVRGALHALGISMPTKRITVNLAPADLLKEGSHFDLPIALGLLTMMEILPKDELMGYLAIGELALDGTLSPVSGALPAAIHANAKGLGLICPQICGSEAAWAGDVRILAAPNLLAIINHFKGRQILEQPLPKSITAAPSLLDMRDIKGQAGAKQALEIAAAGGHNVLMSGPPGTGKSMLAARMPSILPPLTPEESLETSMIHSLAGMLEDGKILTQRPYRAPHHSASTPAMVGGGQRAQPGEISLAHNGVLFLDELPEFSNQTLEALRQPLETRSIAISRANHHVTYPANIQLIAAMNPCKCGYISDPEIACNRAPKCGIDYQTKISGPIYDRIDCHIEVASIQPYDLKKYDQEESSADILARVIKAREIQRARFIAAHPDQQGPTLYLNAHADGRFLEKIAVLDDESQNLLIAAADKMKLSARGYHRVLRLARTIADLEGVELIRKAHIAQALHFRRQYIRKPSSGYRAA